MVINVYFSSAGNDINAEQNAGRMLIKIIGFVLEKCVGADFFNNTLILLKYVCIILWFPQFILRMY